MFQSAPLTEARGDFCHGIPLPHQSGFNPLPSPKQGETAIPAEWQYIINVSIRSPHRSKGRHVIQQWTDSAGMFQSAPLTEARGDCLGECGQRFGSLFQSAPLTEARGDRSHRCWAMRAYSGFNPLPSPKQGETSAEATAQADEGLFQSAPLTEARGDRYCSATASPDRRFNPLPSPKQGETAIMLTLREKAFVSIRSPHRSKGDLHQSGGCKRCERVSIRSPHRSKGDP